MLNGSSSSSRESRVERDVILEFDLAAEAGVGKACTIWMIISRTSLAQAMIGSGFYVSVFNMAINIWLNVMANIMIT